MTELCRSCASTPGRRKEPTRTAESAREPGPEDQAQEKHQDQEADEHPLDHFEVPRLGQAAEAFVAHPILDVWAGPRGCDDVPGVRASVVRAKVVVNEKRVVWLMGELQIAGKCRRSTLRTTWRDPSATAARDRGERDFRAEQPDELQTGVRSTGTSPVSEALVNARYEAGTAKSPQQTTPPNPQSAQPGRRAALAPSRLGSPPLEEPSAAASDRRANQLYLLK